jgi:hypothetical protein
LPAYASDRSSTGQQWVASLPCRCRFRDRRCH